MAKIAANTRTRQTNGVANAPQVAKATVIVVAKRVFTLFRVVVAKILKLVNMERYATPVAGFMMFGLCVTGLNMVPGFELFVAKATEVLAGVIYCALIAFAGIHAFRFVKRCSVEARKELEAQSEATVSAVGSEEG